MSIIIIIRYTVRLLIKAQPGHILTLRLMVNDRKALLNQQNITGFVPP